MSKACPLSWSPDHPSLFRDCRWRPRPSWRNPSAKHSFSRACARCLHRGSLVEVFCNPAKGAPITWENLSRPPLLRHIGVTRPVWPGSVQGPFFPLWLPPPCFQKSRASILPTPNDRRDRFPTARASQDSLVSSRRTNSRTGQILHSCNIDGDSPLNFQTVPLFQTR